MKYKHSIFRNLSIYANMIRYPYLELSDGGVVVNHKTIIVIKPSNCQMR